MDPFMITRTATAMVRAIDTDTTPADERGRFEAIVSVFGNEDSYGDIVEHGAFTRTLAEWVLKGSLPPVVWSHKFSEPENFLGKHDNVEETEQGLRVVGKLNLTRKKAAEVYELMLEGTITEFSWSGLVREYEMIEDSDGWFAGLRLKDIDLWEAGPCFKGANPNTELVSVKTDPRLEQILRTPQLAAKAGRVLSQSNLDSLESAYEQIGKVIEAAKATSEEKAVEEPVSPDPAAPSDNPDGEPVPNPEEAGEQAAQPAEEPEGTAEKTAPDADADRDADVRALLELSTL